jgi:hypothetical protein
VTGVLKFVHNDSACVVQLVTDAYIILAKGHDTLRHTLLSATVEFGAQSLSRSIDRIEADGCQC